MLWILLQHAFILLLSELKYNYENAQALQFGLYVLYSSIQLSADKNRDQVDLSVQFRTFIY